MMLRECNRNVILRNGLIVISLAVSSLSFSHRASSINNNICIAAAVAVGACAVAYNYFTGSNQNAGPHVVLNNGTFGYLLNDPSYNTGTFVSRGDKLDALIGDPNNPGSGLMLSRRARTLYDKRSSGLSPTQRFELAVNATNHVRVKFLQNPDFVYYASLHVYDSTLFNSPFLSLTLNERFAAAFAGSGGAVFLGSFPNRTSIYAYNGGINSNGKRRLKTYKGPVDMDGANEKAGRNIESALYFHRNQQGQNDKLTPNAEFLALGGFYFTGSIQPEQAFRQAECSIRYINGLPANSGLSSRITNIPTSGSHQVERSTMSHIINGKENPFPPSAKPYYPNRGWNSPESC
jgi:hypothetical protein